MAFFLQSVRHLGKSSRARDSIPFSPLKCILGATPNELGDCFLGQEPRKNIQRDDEQRTGQSAAPFFLIFFFYTTIVFALSSSLYRFFPFHSGFLAHSSYLSYNRLPPCLILRLSISSISLSAINIKIPLRGQNGGENCAQKFHSAFVF